MVSSKNCSVVNIINLIKKLVHFCLISAFLILTIRELKNFLSGQTTFLVSRIPKNVTLPSFTVCPLGINQIILNKTLLSQKLLNKRKLPFPINVWAIMQSQIDGKVTTFNLMNEKVLKKNFNATFGEVWEMHCKMNPPLTTLDSCAPCLTFKNPTFKEQFEVGQVS